MRVLAGGLISGVTPSMILITAMFFPANEQWAASTTWYCGVGLGQFVCNWVAFGCYKPEFDGGELALKSWRILFMFGCFAVLLGVLWLILIPDVPTEAWWPRQEEKRATLLRIRRNQQGFGSHKWKWYQVKEAFLEPRTWIYFLGNFSLQVGTGNFSSRSSPCIAHMITALHMASRSQLSTSWVSRYWRTLIIRVHSVDIFRCVGQNRLYLLRCSVSFPLMLQVPLRRW